jgi:hypothetical protein
MLSFIFSLLTSTVGTHAIAFVSGGCIGRYLLARARVALPHTVAELKAQAAPVEQQAMVDAAKIGASAAKGLGAEALAAIAAIEKKL